MAIKPSGAQTAKQPERFFRAQPRRLFPEREQRPSAKRREQRADTDHDLKSDVGHRDRRPVFAGKLVESFDFRFEVSMGEKTQKFRDVNSITHGLGFFRGKAADDERRGLRRVK